MTWRAAPSCAFACANSGSRQLFRPFKGRLRGKTFALILLGFATTDFVITMATVPASAIDIDSRRATVLHNRQFGGLHHEYRLEKEVA